jgi:hypothetical protein
MMDRTAAFKRGFLKKFAELGISPRELEYSLTDAVITSAYELEKSSGVIGDVTSSFKNLMDTGEKGFNLASKAGIATLLATLTLPFAVGGALGSAQARLTSPTERDIKNAHREALRDFLQSKIQEVKARQELNTYE